MEDIYIIKGKFIYFFCVDYDGDILEYMLVRLKEWIEYFDIVEYVIFSEILKKVKKFYY